MKTIKEILEENGYLSKSNTIPYLTVINLMEQYANQTKTPKKLSRVDLIKLLEKRGITEYSSSILDFIIEFTKSIQVTEETMKHEIRMILMEDGGDCGEEALVSILVDKLAALFEIPIKPDYTKIKESKKFKIIHWGGRFNWKFGSIWYNGRCIYSW